jgi:hypothetical protein
MVRRFRFAVTLLIAVVLSIGFAVEAYAASAATSATSRVTPVYKSIAVAGRTISTGYKVGESIIYPGSGGYSIVDNPDINWTLQAKEAYVNNHQAQNDLATFLGSSYAKPSIVSTDTDAYLYGYTFNTGNYFPVSGNSSGGYLSDHSGFEVTGDYTVSGVQPSEPYDYSAWGPNSAVYDYANTPQSLDLSLTWTFVGWSISVSYPPSVSFNGTNYVWNSGPISGGWYYSFSAPLGFISSSSLLRTQTSTTLAVQGTVNVSQNGGVYGYGGSLSEGYNGGFW